MSKRILIFTVEAPCAFINSNERPHHMAKARLTKAWRLATMAETERVMGKPLQPPVRILAKIHKPGNRRWDPNNLAPTTKACVDGMVDAGLIPDDSWREVEGPDHRRGAPIQDAITFIIEELT
ncbi:hypothetical protein [Arthrobacter sp. NA-172]|uniref:hypothetical protein n=1 Tax=Arthrobacter sp. NA-172 TaxID=3367524 RepID=UPI0037550F17